MKRDTFEKNGLSEIERN